MEESSPTAEDVEAVRLAALLGMMKGAYEDAENEEEQELIGNLMAGVANKLRKYGPDQD